ncbi:MAG: CCA tRNA nucleotidyltransferase [Thermoplasmatota archaeon]
MTTHNQIRATVLDKIVPTSAERQELQEAVDRLTGELRHAAAERDVDLSVLLVGSIAKDTYLRGALYIDLFLLFPSDTEREQMKQRALDIGTAVLSDWDIQYAEHPYVRGRYQGYDVDVVPCYRVDDAGRLQSAVDRTPFHTRYVQEHLGEEQKDEVRLLKQFMQGVGCYSAEERVRGFAGYLAELLVIRYGSFMEVLRQAPSWEDGTALWLSSQPAASFPEPFVFVDPVDPSRNVAAAVSEEKRRLFIRAASAYIDRPRLTFFFPRPVEPWPLEQIRPHLERWVGVELPRPGVVDDILYSQVRKAVRSLQTRLREHDFVPVDGAYHVDDEVLLAVQLEQRELQPSRVHPGPPVDQEEHAAAFREKWTGHPRTIEGPSVEDGRWTVKIKRRYRHAAELLRDSMDELNLGKHLSRRASEGQVLTGDMLAQKKYAAFWTEQLSGQMPWER